MAATGCDGIVYAALVQTLVGWKMLSPGDAAALAAVGHVFLTRELAGFMGAGFGWALSKAILWALWTYPASRYIVFGGMAGQEPDEEAFDADPT